MGGRDGAAAERGRPHRLAVVFNLSGAEIIFLLIAALVVLGPDKLPDALRKAGRAYGEFKKVSQGFQSEFRSAFSEPLDELRGTADLMKQATRIPDGEDPPVRVPALGADDDTGSAGAAPVEQVEPDAQGITEGAPAGDDVADPA